MEESEEYYWAEAGSWFTDYVGPYYQMVGNKIFNLQLRYWIEALNKFQQIYYGHYKVEELLLILNLLCNSLETLAGVNIRPPAKDYTPPLMILYKDSLRIDNRWDLRLEKPDLFKNLEEMDNFHKNLCKHIHKSNSRKDLLKQINHERIRKYIRTTKEIWLWILNKKFKGNIPKNQLQFFEYDFRIFKDIKGDGNSQKGGKNG